MDYKDICRRVRVNNPMVHCISNLVAAGDCANLVLAVGGRPIMAQAPEDVAEITAVAKALNLNLGTPDRDKYEAALVAGKTANAKGIPVVVDPVGAGASAFRQENTRKLLAEVHPDILHVNLSEALFLLGKSSSTDGVDSLAEVSHEELRQQYAAELAQKYDCVVLLSGVFDVVTNGFITKTVPGGSERMSKLTGTGCMLSVLCSVFTTVDVDPFTAAYEASVFWKGCANMADFRSMGIGSFHSALFDAAEELATQ